MCEPSYCSYIMLKKTPGFYSYCDGGNLATVTAMQWELQVR